MLATTGLFIDSSSRANLDGYSLTHLLNQKNFFRRQACWLEKISLFNFEVSYIPGSERESFYAFIKSLYSILVHLGASGTLDYLQDHAWWCDMVSDMKAFCETCQTCQQSKPSN